MPTSRMGFLRVPAFQDSNARLMTRLRHTRNDLMPTNVALANLKISLPAITGTY